MILHWPLGYPYALAVMVATGTLPYLYFKWRRWF
jgi:magnesium transporter